MAKRTNIQAKMATKLWGGGVDPVIMASLDWLTPNEIA